MKLAYVRVSTVEQNEARQVEALKKYDIDKWYTEKASAKDTNRKKLKELLDFCREGDAIYIKDFSRLARSTKDLLNIVELLQEKGVTLVSDKENIDSSTPTGKLMLTMIGAINEFERQNLLERQREGIEIAKNKGKYTGRKEVEKPDNWEEVYLKYCTKKITVTQAMEECKLKRNTFYKYAKKYNELNEKITNYILSFEKDGNEYHINLDDGDVSRLEYLYRTKEFHKILKEAGLDMKDDRTQKFIKAIGNSGIATYIRE